MADCEQVLEAARKYIYDNPDIPDHERKRLKEVFERSQPLIIRSADLLQCLEAAAELITSPLGGLFAMEYKRAFNRIIHPIRKSYLRRYGDEDVETQHR